MYDGLNNIYINNLHLHFLMNNNFHSFYQVQMLPYSFIVVNVSLQYRCNIAAIIALPLVAIIAWNIFSIAQPYLYIMSQSHMNKYSSLKNT